MTMYRVENLAWCAGFLDGEGSFKITCNRGGRNVACVVVATQVDKTPVLYLQETYGGSLWCERRELPRRPVWVWTGTTEWVRSVLPHIAPYMKGEKKLQAEFAIAFAKSLKPQNGVPVSAEEITRRLEAREELIQMRAR